MDFQVKSKKMVTLVLSILLAIGSHWIPLPVNAPTQGTVYSSQSVVGEELEERGLRERVQSQRFIFSPKQGG
jgi:hypothetical protein